MNTADLGLPVDVPSTALFTDQYELTMLRAALKAGTAERRSVFEVFTRRLPDGRRYGVVAGTGRVLDAVENFRFDAGVLGGAGADELQELDGQRPDDGDLDLVEGDGRAAAGERFEGSGHERLFAAGRGAGYLRSCWRVAHRP